MIATIAAIYKNLTEVFAHLDTWCSEPAEILLDRPAYELAWTAAEHLEHVSLVNHYLLLTIGKGVATAIRRSRTQSIPITESDLELLEPISDPNAFLWEPPEHMLPQGDRPITEIRQLLAEQRSQCLELLKRMENGEGTLCSFNMSVHGLGRLDMYQWLYFLAQHGRWHLKFLARRSSGPDSLQSVPDFSVEMLPEAYGSSKSESR